MFRRARVDGFAFDAEALLVAAPPGLEVVEVPVTAEERQGSKVHLGGDALRMLADVWKVRRAAARAPTTRRGSATWPAEPGSSSTSATEPSAIERAAARSGDRNTHRL